MVRTKYSGNNGAAMDTPVRNTNLLVMKLAKGLLLLARSKEFRVSFNYAEARERGVEKCPDLEERYEMRSKS